MIDKKEGTSKLHHTFITIIIILLLIMILTKILFF
jgi:hypothetical protein